MKLKFSKYHGAGNDFILVDDRNENFRPEQKAIEKLCDRHVGIGSDGLILLRNKPGFDFEMIYFNADGRLATMCGNGSRCITAFAWQLGMIRKDKIAFSAADGKHEAIILSQSPMIIRVQMADVRNVRLDGTDFILDTGSPHYVKFTDHADEINVPAEGRKIRYLEPFQSSGINVNFVQQEGNSIYVRTYERGVEDETLSCGTGVIASALAALEKGNIPLENGIVEVRTRGGELRVYYKRSGTGFQDIWLEGPAQLVFTGELDHGQ